MPPKEEPKDNDGKEGKSALEEELNLIGGKELVLARMELDTSQNHLKEKIKENKTLMKACEELKSHLETQKADAKDIYYYLHKKLDDNYDVIDSLEKRIIVLKSERERSDELYEKKIAVINKDNEKENARLQTIIKELRDDLHTLTEFKDAKQRMEARIKYLEDHLASEKEGRADDITLLERRNIQEKERLKKEMLIKIKETKQNLLSMTEDQLHTTTKRTILENEQMTTELQYQSKETERLLRRFNRVSEENKRLKTDIDILKGNEVEYAKKSHFFQKLIKKLHEKLKAQTYPDLGLEKGEDKGGSGSRNNNNNSRSRSSRGGTNTPGGRGNSRHSNLASRSGRGNVVRALQEKAGSLEISLEQVCSELDNTREQLQRLMEEQDYSQSLRDEAVGFLMSCLADIKKKGIPSNPQNTSYISSGQGGGGGASITTPTPSNHRFGGLPSTVSTESSAINNQGNNNNNNGNPVQIDKLTMVQRERILMYLLDKLHKFSQSLASRGGSGTFATQQSLSDGISRDGGSRISSTGLPPIDGHQQHSSSTFDDANLANDFTRLFATPGGALGGGTGGDNMGMNMINNNNNSNKNVQSIGIQTDSAAPVTILRSVDVGISGQRGIFSGDGTDSGGYGYSVGSISDETNKSETLTSRLLRGNVRDWGRPAPLYTKVGGAARGSSLYLKKRSGFAGGGSSNSVNPTAQPPNLVGDKGATIG